MKKNLNSYEDLTEENLGNEIKLYSQNLEVYLATSCCSLPCTQNVGSK